MPLWFRGGLPSAALLDAEQRAGVGSALPSSLRPPLEVGEVAARVGGRGRSLDTSWGAGEVEEARRSASAPSPYLGRRRPSQSAYIDEEQVAGVSGGTARQRCRMLQECGGDPCPCLSTMLEDQLREDRRIRSSLTASPAALASAARVDKEQRAVPWSRRGSRAVLANTVDKEQERSVDQRLGEARMGELGLRLAGRMDQEQLKGRGEARRAREEAGGLEKVDRLGQAISVARAAAVFRDSLKEEGEDWRPRWRRRGHGGEEEMGRPEVEAKMRHRTHYSD